MENINQQQYNQNNINLRNQNDNNKQIQNNYGINNNQNNNLNNNNNNKEAAMRERLKPNNFSEINKGNINNEYYKNMPLNQKIGGKQIHSNNEMENLDFPPTLITDTKVTEKPKNNALNSGENQNENNNEINGKNQLNDFDINNLKTVKEPTVINTMNQPDTNQNNKEEPKIDNYYSRQKSI